MLFMYVLSIFLLSKFFPSNRLLVVLMSIVGTFAFMVRDLEQVLDVSLYYNEFQSIETFSDIFLSRLFWKGEYAFLFLLYCNKIFFGSFGFVVVIFSLFFLFYTSIINLAENYDLHRNISIIIFVSLVGVSLVLFNTIRQGFAISFLFLSINATHRNQLLRGLIILIIGSLFHKSVLIPGFIWYLLTYNNIKHIVLYILTLIIVAPFIVSYSTVKLNQYMYTNDDVIIDSIKWILISVILGLSILLNKRINRIHYFFIVLLVLALPLLQFDKVGSRLLLYAQGFLPVLIVPQVSRIRLHWEKIALMALCYVIAISQFDQIKNLFPIAS